MCGGRHNAREMREKNVDYRRSRDYLGAPERLIGPGVLHLYVRPQAWQLAVCLLADTADVRLLAGVDAIVALKPPISTSRRRQRTDQHESSSGTVTAQSQHSTVTAQSQHSHSTVTAQDADHLDIALDLLRDVSDVPGEPDRLDDLDRALPAL